MDKDTFDVDFSLPKKNHAIGKRVRENKRLKDIEDTVKDIPIPETKLNRKPYEIIENSPCEILPEVDEVLEEAKATKYAWAALNNKLSDPDTAPNDLIKLVLAKKLNAPNIHLNIELKSRDDLIKFMGGIGRKDG